jgi:hypothetical protein
MAACLQTVTFGAKRTRLDLLPASPRTRMTLSGLSEPSTDALQKAYSITSSAVIAL